MINDETYYFMKEDNRTTRQRVDPQRVRHFTSWLVDSQLLVSSKITLIVYPFFHKP